MKPPLPSSPASSFRRILVLLVVLFAVSTAGFVHLEGLSWANALYFTMSTITTVGYGDITPHTQGGRWFSLVVMLGGVSIGFYAVGLLAAMLVEGRFGKLVEERRMRKQIETIRGHFVICGYGQVGAALTAELRRQGARFVVIERDPERAEAAREDGCLVVEGDATDDAVLAEAQVARARGLATVISDDAENLYITVSSRAIHPTMPIVARGSTRRGERYLAQSGATNVVLLDDLGATRMARSLLHPEVVSFWEEMMSSTGSESRMDVMKLPQRSSLTGRSLKDLDLRARLGIQVLAIKRADRYLASPGPEERLAAEDVLLLVGHPDNLDRLRADLEAGESASS